MSSFFFAYVKLFLYFKVLKKGDNAISEGDLFYLVIVNFIFYFFISLIGMVGGSLIAYINNFYLREKPFIFDLFNIYSSSIILVIIYYYLSSYIINSYFKLMFIFLLMLILVIIVSSKILTNKFMNYRLYYQLKCIGGKESQVYFTYIKNLGMKFLFNIILLNFFFEVNLVALFPIIDSSLRSNVLFKYNIHYYIYSLILENKYFLDVNPNIIFIYSLIPLLLLFIYKNRTENQ